jgi:hypothetical protein
MRIVGDWGIKRLFSQHPKIFEIFAPFRFRKSKGLKTNFNRIQYG